MEKQRMKTFRMVFLAMMVAIGVVISPILRIEGMCPTAHLINITCSVFMGPWYSLLCACMIGVIRMMFMGIPPLALTGAVFGAFISGVFYRASKGKIICAVLGGILSGHGLFDGKRRTERILLYADVYFRYDHGRNCRIHLSEGVKPDRNACEISGKSGSKSL